MPGTAQDRRSGRRLQRTGSIVKIGITCYPTFGGSGVVATELGIALAKGAMRSTSSAMPSPRVSTTCTSASAFTK